MPLSARSPEKGRCAAVARKVSTGGVAQLGERLNGIQEVSGSIPLVSTPVGLGWFRMVQVGSGWSRWFSPSAGIAQLVEHNLAKVGVAGSSPVSRLKYSGVLGR